jgi:hypothetical protein
MSRQEQFKAELFDLLRRYKVEMSVEEERGQYDTVATGINFYSWQEGPEESRIIEGVYACAEAAREACATLYKKKHVSYADFDFFEVQNETI